MTLALHIYPWPCHSSKYNTLNFLLCRTFALIGRDVLVSKERSSEEDIATEKSAVILRRSIF